MSKPDRPYLRRVVVGALASSAGNAWTILLGVITLPVLLRGLGRDAFGVWAMLLVFNGTTGWLSILSVGIGVGGTRLTATAAAQDRDDEVAALLRALLVVAAVVGAAAAVLFAAVGPMLLDALLEGASGTDLDAVAGWFAVYLLVEQVALAVHAALDGMQRVGASRGADSARRTLTLGCAALTASATNDLADTTFAFAASAAAYTTVLVVVVSSRTRLWRRGPQRGHVGQVVRAAMPVVPLTSAGVAQRSVDRVVAGVVFGPSAVALVEIATQIQSAAATVLTSTSYVATTSAPWLHAQEAVRQQRELLVRGTRLTLLATYPVAVGLALLAEPLVEVWLGDRGAGASRLVPVALASVVVVAPLQVGSNMLLGLGRAGRVLRAALPALVVNVVASVVLAEAIGLRGVFLGTVVGAAVLVPMLAREVAAATGVHPRELLTKAVAPALLPAALVGLAVGAVVLAPLGAWSTLVLGGAAAALVYLAAAWRWGGAASDLHELRDALRRGS